MNNLIISKDNGYSLFFENKKGELDCTAYHTGFHMTDQEIAEVLGITNTAVGQIVRRSMSKIYLKLKRNNDITPFEIMSIIVEMFNVKTESQYNKLFGLFSDKIKGEIYTDAKRIFN